jgi:hypothetical protein
MTLIFVDQGEVLGLEYLVNKSSPENLVLRLFKNDVTDGLSAAQIEALDETDFTEADFTGYSAVTLTGATWTVTAGDPTVAAYPIQSFASTADQTQQLVYGYYLTRATGGELVAFEMLAAPVPFEFDEDTLLVTPRITGKDEQD